MLYKRRWRALEEADTGAGRPGVATAAAAFSSP